MPTTVQVTGYTYAELRVLKDQRAADRARQWMVECTLQDEWWDAVYEVWKHDLELIGFLEPHIGFRLGGQDQGVCFTADMDMGRLIRFLADGHENNPDLRQYLRYRELNRHLDEAGVRIGHNPRYRFLLSERLSLSGVMKHTGRGEHSSTVIMEWDDPNEYETPKIYKLMQDFKADVETLRVQLCRAIYKSLEEEEEYLTGDAHLEDMAKANEWLFDEDGRII
jgi:hypothetical protein